MWNAIVSRLKVKPRDALVLYLAGHQDLDREIALSKGFSPHNLIAIEKDKKVLAELRRKKRLCIHGEFTDAVRSACINHKIDVVFGDFCCGLHDAFYLNMPFVSCHPNLSGSVFAFNFLRGRDKSSNFLRVPGLVLSGTDSFRHRGGNYLYWLYTLGYINEGGDCLNGVFNSYRSKTQIFDSLVFENRPSDAFMKRLSGTNLNVVFNQETYASIAAVFAHRTRRIASPTHATLL